MNTEIIFTIGNLWILLASSLVFMMHLGFAALESGLSPVLQWDTLCTESNFENCIKRLDDLPLSKFAAIRVQDIGAAEWVRHELPEIPIHFIAEAGNHNLT